MQYGSLSRLFSGSALALMSAGLVSAVPFAYCDHTGPTGTFTPAQFLASGCISGEKQGNRIPDNDDHFVKAGGGDSQAKVEESIQFAQGITVTLSGVKFDSNEFGSGNSGTWTSSFGPIHYITVKAANGYALYYVNGATSGSWTTAGLLNNGNQQPGISHITLWQSAAPVPEPSYMLMLLGGIASLVGFRRFRRTA